MNAFIRENSYAEDWSFLVIAAFLLLFLGIMLGFFMERSVKSLYLLNQAAKHPSLPLTIPQAKESLPPVSEELLPPIDPQLVPRHVAVIMDGNRRFGRLSRADPLQGHWAGGQTLVDFVQWCIQDGVQAATVYAFSTENWRRDPMEVTTLMTIFAKYAETFVQEALAKSVKVKVFSTDFEKLPPKVQASVRDLEEKTNACSAFSLNICLSYGGRSEILQACKQVLEKVETKELSAKEIDESLFSSYLVTRDLPDPEILIRTSGEYRLSNFLLWQTAYSELFFVNKFWPEFSQKDFRQILHEYVKRGRRFGK